MPRTHTVHYRPQHPRRHVATTEDVERMWTLKHLGYTWLMIAEALGLTMYAIDQAKRREALAEEEDKG